jgi:hypothetical protein
MDKSCFDENEHLTNQVEQKNEDSVLSNKNMGALNKNIEALEYDLEAVQNMARYGKNINKPVLKMVSVTIIS